jgi:hypothetical protein
MGGRGDCEEGVCAAGGRGETAEGVGTEEEMSTYFLVFGIKGLFGFWMVGWMNGWVLKKVYRWIPGQSITWRWVLVTVYDTPTVGFRSIYGLQGRTR